jgi:hypothetical protein
MRRQLQLFLGAKYHFSADVGRFGYQYTPKGIEPCMLLYDVAFRAGNVIVTAQHCWTEVNSEVAQFNPQGGERISFDGTIKQYYKLNSRGLERIDYNVGQLENIDLVTHPYDNGLRFSEYWQNVKQSHLFNRKTEVQCTA